MIVSLLLSIYVSSAQILLQKMTMNNSLISQKEVHWRSGVHRAVLLRTLEGHLVRSQNNSWEFMTVTEALLSGHKIKAYECDWDSNSREECEAIPNARFFLKGLTGEDIDSPGCFSTVLNLAEKGRKNNTRILLTDIIEKACHGALTGVLPERVLKTSESQIEYNFQNLSGHEFYLLKKEINSLAKNEIDPFLQHLLSASPSLAKYIDSLFEVKSSSNVYIQKANNIKTNYRELLTNLSGSELHESLKDYILQKDKKTRHLADWKKDASLLVDLLLPRENTKLPVCKCCKPSDSKDITRPFVTELIEFSHAPNVFLATTKSHGHFLTTDVGSTWHVLPDPDGNSNLAVYDHFMVHPKMPSYILLSRRDLDCINTAQNQAILAIFKSDTNDISSNAPECKRKLWFSKNYGKKWIPLVDHIDTASWGPSNFPRGVMYSVVNDPRSNQLSRLYEPLQDVFLVENINKPVHQKIGIFTNGFIVLRHKAFIVVNEGSAKDPNAKGTDALDDLSLFLVEYDGPFRAVFLPNEDLVKRVAIIDSSNRDISLVVTKETSSKTITPNYVFHSDGGTFFEEKLRDVYFQNEGEFVNHFKGPIPTLFATVVTNTKNRLLIDSPKENRNVKRLLRKFLEAAQESQIAQPRNPIKSKITRILQVLDEQDKSEENGNTNEEKHSMKKKRLHLSAEQIEKIFNEALFDPGEDTDPFVPTEEKEKKTDIETEDVDDQNKEIKIAPVNPTGWLSKLLDKHDFKPTISKEKKENNQTITEDDDSSSTEDQKPEIDLGPTSFNKIADNKDTNPVVKEEQSSLKPPTGEEISIVKQKIADYLLATVKNGRSDVELSTMISSDLGVTWREVKAPSRNNQGQKILCRSCKFVLHHGNVQDDIFLNLYYGHRTAVMISHGYIDDGKKHIDGTFASLDLGYNWKMISNTIDWFSVIESAGVVALIPKLTREIKISNDWMITWSRYQLPENNQPDISINGVTSDPMGDSRNMLIWGETAGTTAPEACLFNVILGSEKDRPCENDDFRIEQPRGACFQGTLGILRKHAFKKCIDLLERRVSLESELLPRCKCDITNLPCATGFSRGNSDSSTCSLITRGSNMCKLEDNMQRINLNCGEARLSQAGLVKLGLTSGYLHTYPSNPYFGEMFSYQRIFIGFVMFIFLTYIVYIMIQVLRAKSEQVALPTRNDSFILTFYRKVQDIITPPVSYLKDRYTAWRLSRNPIIRRGSLIEQANRLSDKSLDNEYEPVE